MTRLPSASRAAMAVPMKPAPPEMKTVAPRMPCGWSMPSPLRRHAERWGPAARFQPGVVAEQVAGRFARKFQHRRCAVPLFRLADEVEEADLLVAAEVEDAKTVGRLEHAFHGGGDVGQVDRI